MFILANLVAPTLVFGAAAKSSGGGGGGSGVLGQMFKYLYQQRTALTYAESDLSGLSSPSIGHLPRFTNYSVEADFLVPLSIHVGYRGTFTQAAQIKFNGAAEQRGEIYFTVGELGLKVFVPIGFFVPWVGGGTLYGSGAFTNPKTRGNDNHLAAFENETHSVWGDYWHAGADLMFFSNLGIRAYYQSDRMNTERYYNLQESGGFKFVHQRVAAGIVFKTP